jgi:steroid delta-isomerase-like uncharacterized protein
MVASGCAAEAELYPPPPPPPSPPASTGASPSPEVQGPTAVAPPKLAAAELHKRTLASYLAAFNAHDPKKLSEVYRVDGVVASPGPNHMTEVRGRDAIEKSHVGLFAAFPDMKMGTERVLHGADVAVQQWATAATHKVELAGIKPTNKPVGVRGVTIFWFDGDGLVRRDHTYFDGATMSVQIGTTKGRARPAPALPAGEPEWIAATGGADEVRNVEAIKAAWAALEKKDEKTFLDLYADDLSVVNLNEAEDKKGKKAFKDGFAVLGKAFPDLRLVPQNVWAFGNYVVAEAVMSGTHKGALGPFKPSDKPVVVHFVDVLQLKDGKIVQATSYASNLEMLAQLGVPTKAGAPSAKPGAKKDPGAKSGPAPAAAPKPNAGAATPAPKSTATAAASPPKSTATPAATSAPKSTATPAAK